MKKIWYLIYNIAVIPLLDAAVFIAKLFKPKIRIGVEGRKKLYENLIIALAGIDRKKKMIWFHSSSMGEFEQAKPIIEKLKAEQNVNVIVTFFSPSGYDNSLKYSYADIISYFPYDTPFLTMRFLNMVQPDIAVFMRYDIWPNMIWNLKEKNIPCLLVDATMRKKTARKWIIAKSFHKSLYSCITNILAVSNDDVENFSEFKIDQNKIKSVGDTRFDRVYQKSLQAKEKKLFKDDFFAGKKVFVFGSSWESDEEVILPAMLKLMKNDMDVISIIAPHEPTEEHLDQLEQTLSGKMGYIRFSLLNEYKNERIIIIDSIGVLLTLYSYADVSFVGGSFKQGIHNVLEPAVYGIPVVFGPKHENSQEAIKLNQIGGAYVVRDRKQAYKIFRKIFSNNLYREAVGKICSGYVKENIGATARILEEINKYI